MIMVTRKKFEIYHIHISTCSGANVTSTKRIVFSKSTDTGSTADCDAQFDRAKVSIVMLFKLSSSSIFFFWKEQVGLHDTVKSVPNIGGDVI